MTPLQALAKVMRTRRWHPAASPTVRAEETLRLLAIDGFVLVPRPAVLHLPDANMTVAPTFTVRCWTCGWERSYGLEKDAKAQGTKHRCPL